jgi:hypothetical protein
MWPGANLVPATSYEDRNEITFWSGSRGTSRPPSPRDDSAGLFGSVRDQLSGLSDPLSLLNALNQLLYQSGQVEIDFLTDQQMCTLGATKEPINDSPVRLVPFSGTNIIAGRHRRTASVTYFDQQLR